MKKLFLFSLLTTFLLCLYSCGGASDKKSDELLIKSDEVDHMILSNPEGLKKVYDLISAKLDTNIRYVDKVFIKMSYPEVDVNEEETRLFIDMAALNKNDPNTLTQFIYHSSSAKWTQSTLSINLIGGDVETFVLKDNLMDLSGLTSDKLNKVVQDAFSKYKNDEKYNFQYVYLLKIIELPTTGKQAVEVAIKGQLKSNKMIKTETLTVPLSKVLEY